MRPQAVAHDLHPDFFSTQLALRLAERWQVSPTPLREAFQRLGGARLVEVLRDKQCEEKPCELGAFLAEHSEPKGGCPVSIHIPQVIDLIGKGKSFPQAIGSAWDVAGVRAAIGATHQR